MAWRIAFLLLIWSCTGKAGRKDRVQTSGDPVSQNVNEIVCWTGTLEGSIPLLLYYKRDSNVLAGKLFYLNTGKMVPIRIIGEWEEDGSVRIQEFGPDGNIFGVIVASKKGDVLEGIWASTKKELEYKLVMHRKDTVITPFTLDAVPDSIFGEYAYRYGKEGAEGSLRFGSLGQKAVFSIFSVTRAPSRNIAQIEPDTIDHYGTRFRYKVPSWDVETIGDSCAVEVRFYRDFAVVHYTNGYCNGYFGLNATIDGIFLKVTQ